MTDRSTRRTMLGRVGLLLGSSVVAGSATGATIGPDGLHVQPWFLQSFLDLREDVAAAAAVGKRLALVIEQKGCVYCRDMHEVNLADPGTVAYIVERFEVLQLDLHGARPVTDTDGKELEERVFARRARAIATPTIIFLPRELDAATSKPITEVEVARMPGYLPPREFFAMFRYVAEEAYRQGSFQDYLRRAG